MREIKFRAWIKNKMKQWDLEFFSDMSPVTGYGSEFPDKDDPEIILMQFTGLKDKNGKDVWEGDLIKYYNDILIVEYDESTASFQMGFSSFVLDQEVCSYDDIEVIGNIYENPELIKRKPKRRTP